MYPSVEPVAVPGQVCVSPEGQVSPAPAGLMLTFSV